MNRQSLFWAIYLIAVGVMLLIKFLFRLDYNAFSVAIALLVLLSGVFLLTGGFGGQRPRAYANGGGNYFFFSGTITTSAEDSGLTVAFSDATVVLPPNLPENYEVTSLFANTVVRLPEGWAVRVDGHVAFGALESPEGSILGFGERVLLVGEGVNATLRVSSLFGRVVIQD